MQPNNVLVNTAAKRVDLQDVAIDWLLNLVMRRCPWDGMFDAVNGRVKRLQRNDGPKGFRKKMQEKIARRATWID